MLLEVRPVMAARELRLAMAARELRPATVAGAGGAGGDGQGGVERIAKVFSSPEAEPLAESQ